MRTGVVVAAVALSTTAGVVAPSAVAEPAAADGPVAHFVVLGPQGGSLDTTEASIAAAGGAVLQSWPQIGVVIATSADPDFAAEVRGRKGVAAAGASRNLAELDPAPAGTSGTQVGDGVEEIVPATPKATRETADPTASEEPLEANQWDMRQIKADAANAVSGGSGDVLVGVLDTGIDAAHPDLAANVDAASSVGCQNEGVPDTSPAAWGETVHTHGTHVSGTIAADRNGIGIAGVAPDVKVASVRVVDDDGYIYPEYAICGFIWAAEHGMDVTNNSYFIDPWYLWCLDDPDQAAVLHAVKRAVDYSARNGVINVGALGNSNWDLSGTITDPNSPNNGTPIERTVGNECYDIPSELPGFVGVSSVGPEERKSFYSNYGVSEVDVTAPGGDSQQVADTPDGNGRVLSTVPGGDYGYSQGTSMASPHVAGVVALLRSTHPEWRSGQVIRALGRHADRVPCPPGGEYDPDGTGEWLATCEGGKSGRGFYGPGLVDALDAVTR